MHLENQKETPLPYGELSAEIFIAGHFAELSQLLEPRVRKEDMLNVIDFLTRNPTYLASLIENNFQKSERDRKKDIIDQMVNKSLLIIMMGARRHGKTATAFHLAEELLKMDTDKKVYWFGYSPAVKKYYPEITQTLDMKKLHDCILLFDEAAVFMMGRKSMTTERLKYIEQIPVLGHNDITTLYLTQIERIDVWLWGFCDWVWFKPYPGTNFTETKLTGLAMHQFMIPTQKCQNYIYDRQNGKPWFFDNPVPDRWCDALSKPYRRIEDIKEAVKYLHELEKASIGQRDLESMVALRGWDLEELYSHT